MRQLAKGIGLASQVVTLTPPDGHKDGGLPERLTVRFVWVMLKTGNAEILATSLLDEHPYSSADFAKLHQLRWGIETFLWLTENPSGIGKLQWSRCVSDLVHDVIEFPKVSEKTVLLMVRRLNLMLAVRSFSHW